MIQKIKKIILKENVDPSFIGLFTNPFYFARKGLVFHIRELSAQLNGKILDVGCGNKPYEKYCIHAENYIGLEMDTPENRKNNIADYFYKGKRIPFKDKSFNCIITNQVFEHVFNPMEFLSEVNRVLQRNGKLLLTVPFVWDEHEQPYDYARYSSFGIKYLLENHGFEVLQLRKSINDIRVVFQLLNAYLFKKIYTKYPVLNIVIGFFFIAPVNIIGEIFSKITPENDDLYLDNIILARKR